MSMTLGFFRFRGGRHSTQNFRGRAEPCCGGMTAEQLDVAQMWLAMASPA